MEAPLEAATRTVTCSGFCASLSMKKLTGRSVLSCGTSDHSESLGDDCWDGKQGGKKLCFPLTLKRSRNELDSEPTSYLNAHPELNP